MKRYGLIGCPLLHSASARYFTEKFSREALTECRYDLFELSAIDRLPALLSDIPDLCGFNVTIPYKQAVIPLLDDLSPEARAIGAVNCVSRKEGRWVGYNTDAEGFRVDLERFLGDERPEQALILGTGGASRAVQYVLVQLGIPFDLVSRDPAQGNYTYDNLPATEVTAHRLIINTSPVGMYPNDAQAPRIPYAYITPGHYLYDLIYNPPRTSFLDYGCQRGAHICNGQGMFEAQAEASWRIWNGMN